MRIELRDERRRKVGRIAVDPAIRPTRVSVIEPGVHEPEREFFLDWDTAIDDAGQLRRCVACGCTDLFREKAFPQVTGFVVVLAFVSGVIGVLGLATDLPVIIVMIVVLLLDVAILVFSQRRLVCYRCRTSYHDLPIARYHRSWDRTIAERYPAGPPSAHRAAAGLPAGAEPLSEIAPLGIAAPEPSMFGAPANESGATVLVQPPPRRISSVLESHPAREKDPVAWPSSRK